MSFQPVWYREWKQLPVLESDVICDVCVVGLGASGLTAIVDLASCGFHIVGIDA